MDKEIGIKEIPTMKYYIVFKRDGILPHEAMQMKLEHAPLRAMNQAQEDRGCGSPLTLDTQRRQTVGPGTRRVGAGGWLREGSC